MQYIIKNKSKASTLSCLLKLNKEWICVYVWFLSCCKCIKEEHNKLLKFSAAEFYIMCHFIIGDKSIALHNICFIYFENISKQNSYIKQWRTAEYVSLLLEALLLKLVSI